MTPTTTNPNFLIVPSAISITPNSYNNDPQYCIVGTAVGAAIRMTDVWKGKIWDTETKTLKDSSVNIGLSNGTTYKKWNISGGQYCLPSSSAGLDCFIYVRVPKQDGNTADFAFTTHDLDIKGQYKSTNEEGQETIVSATNDFYFVKLATLKYSSGQRTVTDFDTGYLATDKYIKEDNSAISDMFEASGDSIKVKKPFLSLIIKNSLQLGSVVVTGIRNLAAGIEGWASDDTRLATCANIAAYIKSKMDDFDNRYLRKDKDDKTTHAISLGKLIVNDDQTNTDNDLAIFDHLYRDVSGAGLWRDAAGFLHLESDYIAVHNKLTAKEVEIEELTYVGGTIVLSPADGFKASMVQPLDANNNVLNSNTGAVAFRILWRAKDSEGIEVKNMWKVGDQAMSQTFNIKREADRDHGSFEHDSVDLTSSFWWRVVTAVSTEPIQITTTVQTNDGDIEGQNGTTEQTEEYHYIVVSNRTNGLTDAERKKYYWHGDVPAADETVVMLGHQKQNNETDTDAKVRQNAIILKSCSTTPYLREYVGIKTLESLTEEMCEVRIQPDNSKFTGDVVFKGSPGSGSGNDPQSYTDLINKLQSMIDEYNNLNSKVAQLSGIGFNYIRNSGFVGDFLSSQLNSDGTLNANSSLYSDPYRHWIVEDTSKVYPNDDTSVENGSTSGKSMTILSGGLLKQKLTMTPSKSQSYSFSFKASGELLSVVFKDVDGNIVCSKSFSLTSSYERYLWENFTPDANIAYIEISGNGRICELMLNQGTTASNWCYCILDNSDELAYYQSVQYLANAMDNGQTYQHGGLILTSLIELGDWPTNETTGEKTFSCNAGINGQLNVDSSTSITTLETTPAFWAGGTQSMAIIAAQWYTTHGADGTLPSETNLANQAKAVITHDGKAIFNNAYIRGSIYADSGYFKGELKAATGTFAGSLSAATGSFKGSVNIADGKIKLNADGSGSLANNGITWKPDGSELKIKGSIEASGGFAFGSCIKISSHGFAMDNTTSLYVYSGDEEGNYIYLPPYPVDGQQVIISNVSGHKVFVSANGAEQQIINKGQRFSDRYFGLSNTDTVIMVYISESKDWLIVNSY